MLSGAWVGYFIVNSVTSELYVYNIFFEVNNVYMQGDQEQTTDDHCDYEKTALSKPFFKKERHVIKQNKVV